MEFTLNLAWALLAAALGIAWLRLGRPRGSELRMQFVALAVLVLVLFPVISVSDDLQALQNPAEVDSCVRRDHVTASAHSTLPAVVALPQPLITGLSLGVQPFAAFRTAPPRVADHPGLAAVENRPPPAA
jgi:hypothetical protein